MKSINLQFIEEVVWKHIPEVLELKFGCKIAGSVDVDTFGSEHSQWQEFVGIILDSSFEDGDDELGWIEYRTNEGKIRELDLYKADFQVLGRDIQLSDVLIAFSKKFDTHGYEMSLFRMNSTLEIRQNVLTLPGPEIKETGNKCIWDLTKPLHEQSESTITSIAELLKE